jgi:hypothetical protein
MWVKFERGRHAPLLAKGTRVRLRKLRALSGIFGGLGEAEIRGVTRIGGPFRYHVKYRLWGQLWPSHEWVGARGITHIWVNDPGTEPSGISATSDQDR